MAKEVVLYDPKQRSKRGNRQCRDEVKMIEVMSVWRLSTPPYCDLGSFQYTCCKRNFIFLCSDGF